jgi:hypothetical protein
MFGRVKRTPKHELQPEKVLWDCWRSFLGEEWDVGVVFK